MTTYIVTPTPTFRFVQHGDRGQSIQQRCLVTEGAGGAKERRFVAWLDMSHTMFAAVESPSEAANRELIERAHASKLDVVTILPGAG